MGQQRDGIDAEPRSATCDVCGHAHVCYVGGRAIEEDAEPTSWEVHVCLGCLMRAASPHGFDSCEGCTIGRPDPTGASAGHA